MKNQLTIAIASLLMGLCLHTPTFAQTPGRSGLQVREQNGTRKVRLDVVICLDTTGSMGDEIAVVKERLRELVGRIAQGTPKPDVRFGIVLYKDRGDSYVTKKFDFTRDVAVTQKNIANAEASGGGDTPESVNEALHVSVSEMEWDMAPGVERLIFVIGDAPPHFYADDYDWKKEIVAAQSKRISINTIGCSGIDDEGGAQIWQEIATRTEGRFDYLAYLSQYENKGEKRYTLSEGSRRYELAAGAKSRWREGGARLAALGLAKVSGRAGSISGENNLDYILSCGAQSAAQSAGTRYAKNTAINLKGRTLARGFDSTIRLGQAKVIESDADWAMVWAESGKGTPLPKVDWTREVVALVTAPHAQAVEITGATRQNDETLVSYRLIPRAADAPKPSPSELRSAYHFVAIPREKGNVVKLGRSE